MGTYWKLLAGYDAETTTYSECAKTGMASPYTPTENATLIGLRTFANSDAATTLQEHVQFKLTCQTFTPNSIECGSQGSGLCTAPAFHGGVAGQNDWQVNQKVAAGVPITIEARNVTADTPVTVDCLLYGLFQSGGN